MVSTPTHALVWVKRSVDERRLLRAPRSGCVGVLFSVTVLSACNLDGPTSPAGSITRIGPPQLPALPGETPGHAGLSFGGRKLRLLIS